MCLNQMFIQNVNQVIPTIKWDFASVIDNILVYSCLLSCFEAFKLFLFQTVFTLAPFPYRKVVELREKYTYDIHPFSTFGKDNTNERINERQGKCIRTIFSATI